jgi:Leucine-rich repeat (LRR) protein
MLVSGAMSFAAEGDEVAATWVESVGGKLVRDAKTDGRPIIEVDLAFKKGVTNDGLKNLAGCKNIKSLNLFFDEKITDEGMKHLKELKTLEVLTLTNTGIGDAGLTELKDLKSLKDLGLAGATRLTDKATETVKEFTNLDHLALPSTITEKGVKNLAPLKKLKVLYIGGANLTDGAVKDIAENMPELEELELGLFAKEGTRITDESISQLSKLKKLRKLGLVGSKITAEGLKQLEKALPDCRIKI